MGTTYRADSLICPYCEYEQDDAWELHEGCGEIECQNCEREFIFEKEVTAVYSTKIIKDD